ncbi:MAG: sigma-70 family RNA polymerase sigma factor [Deltaproteobacteria bacterium]|nr:sigma-70 family RNA polymerase sigma factor [Deltaproteobacteria bacterium]
MTTSSLDTGRIIRKIVEILEDDAFRAGGTLPYARVIHLCEKKGLDASTVLEVQRRLRAAEVTIVDAPADSIAEAVDENRDTKAESTFDEGYTEASALSLFFRDLRQYSLMPHHELVRRIRLRRLGESARQRLIASTPSEEQLALEAMVADGEAARAEIATANLRLVVHIAKDFARRGFGQLEDLVQDGMSGLLSAIDRFDPERGTRFSTYANYWIRQSIQRYSQPGNQLVRLPMHVRERVPKLLRVRARLRRERGGQEPSVQETAEILGWPPELVHFLDDMRHRPASLDAPLDEGVSASLVDFLAAPSIDSPDLHYERAECSRILWELVEELDLRDAYVMIERFGLGSDSDRTLEDLGEELGVTRERIRQIQEKGLQRLRHPSRTSRLDGYGPEEPLRGDDHEH